MKKFYGICKCGICTKIKPLKHLFDKPKCAKCGEELIRKGTFTLPIENET